MLEIQHIEIERIYAATLGSGIRSLAVTSANSGEGVSSVAMALAQRHLIAGHATLLVDLNLFRPSLVSAFEEPLEAPNDRLFQLPQLVAPESQQVTLMGIPAPSRKDAILGLRRTGALKKSIEQWLESFDAVIIDTSPLNRVNQNNIPAETVIEACGNAILVVLSGVTTNTMVQSALDKVSATGGLCVGLVLNDQFNPSLRKELIRKLTLLDRFWPSLAKGLKGWLHKKQLLSLEI